MDEQIRIEIHYCSFAQIQPFTGLLTAVSEAAQHLSIISQLYESLENLWLLPLAFREIVATHGPPRLLPVFITDACHTHFTDSSSGAHLTLFHGLCVNATQKRYPCHVRDSPSHTHPILLSAKGSQLNPILKCLLFCNSVIL